MKFHKTVHNKSWIKGSEQQCCFYRNHDLPAIVYMNNMTFGWYGFKRPFNLAMQISDTGTKHWYHVDENTKIIGVQPYKILFSNGTIVSKKNC